MHKEFERIPVLRPIVDTIGSTHYGVGKFITKLLNPLTQNAKMLKKRTLKKLVLDTCSKTALFSGGTIYEHKDGVSHGLLTLHSISRPCVSMGATLRPVFANIITTELKRVVVDRLIRSGRLKFYARYVDF